MTTLHELGKVLHDIRCRHGEVWGGRYCERCTVEQDQRIAAAYRAGQAMHHQMVWWLCHGVADVDAFHFDIHGMWDREALRAQQPRSSHDIAADVFRRTRGR